MEYYSRDRKPNQARKEKLANNLTGAPRPKRPYRKGSNRRAPKHTFIILGENILHNKELSSKAKVVYAELSRWTGDKKGKEAFAGIKKIASNLGESESTVKRGMKELQEAGFIKRRRRFGKSSLTKLFEPRNESGEKRQVAHLQNRKNAVDKGKPIRDVNTDLTREVNTELTVESGETTSNQGKQDENEAPLRQVVNIKKKSSTTEPTSSGELFGSVTSKDLKNKNNDALNINELIATLQQRLLNAGVKWVSINKSKELADKTRGQMRDLRDRLGSSGEVVNYMDWFIDEHLEQWKGANKYNKMGQFVGYDDNYRTALEDEAKKREKAQEEKEESLRMNIWIHSENGKYLKPEEDEELEEMGEGELRQLLERIEDRKLATVGI